MFSLLKKMRAAKAEKARAAAKAKYDVAHKRRDDRRKGELWPRLHAATNDALRAEVGR